MKQAMIPLYIHFGEIPEDGKSRIHNGDLIEGKELGLSVYRAVESNGLYFPILPEEANESGIFTYFNYLLGLASKKYPIYLLTGTESKFEGHDRESLLIDFKIIKQLNYLDIFNV